MIKKKPPEQNISVIYGIHPVLETVGAGRRRIDEIFVSKGPSLPSWAQTSMTALAAPVTSISPNEMLALTGTPHHQGLAARVGPFPYTDLEDFLAVPSKRSLVLILDEVQDPANLGNILRSAECLAAAAVVFTKDRSVSVTPVVEKSSAGAAAHIPVVRVVNLTRAMEELKASGYWVYGTAADAKKTVYALDLTEKVAFVLGSEGKGMRRLVREYCDDMVSVPMFGKTASLNVSQVATILLAEALRQRITGGGDAP